MMGIFHNDGYVGVALQRLQSRPAAHPFVVRDGGGPSVGCNVVSIICYQETLTDVGCSLLGPGHVQGAVLVVCLCNAARPGQS